MATLSGALFAAVVWGGMFPVFGALLHKLDPFWLTSVRYGGAALLLMAILLIAEGPRAFRLEGRGWTLLLLGSSGIAAFNILVLNGLKATNPTHGALIVATGPLFTALLLWLRSGTRPAPVTLGAMAVAFVGVAMVATRGNLAAELSGGGLGDVAIALGVAGFAWYSIGAQSFTSWSGLRFTTLSLSFGALTTIVLTLLATALGIAHVPSFAPTTGDVAGMLYLIVFCAVLAFIGWNFSVGKVGAQTAMLFVNLVPIVTLAAEIVMGHHFGIIEYSGAALTIGALVANNLMTRTPARRLKAVASPAIADAA